MKKEVYDKLNETLTSLEVVINGGSGSGNFGHAGREGKRGGSAKSGIKTHSKTYKWADESYEATTAEYTAEPDVLIIKSGDQVGYLDNYPSDSEVAYALHNRKLKDLTDFAEDGDLIREHLDAIDGKQSSYESKKSDRELKKLKRDIRKIKEDMAGITDLKKYIKTSQKAIDSTQKGIDTFMSLLGQGYDDSMLQRKIDENKKILRTLQESHEAKLAELDRKYRELDAQNNGVKFENGGKGSGNFGHSGREGKVGGSSRSGQGVASSDLYNKYPEVKESAKRLVSHRPTEKSTEHEQWLYYHEVRDEREKLFKLYGEDIMKASDGIREWNSGAYMWEWQNQDKDIFSDLDIALSKAIIEEAKDNSTVYRTQVDSISEGQMLPSKYSSWSGSLYESLRWAKFLGGSESKTDLFETKVTKDNVLIAPEVMYSVVGQMPVNQREYVLSIDSPIKAKRTMTRQELGSEFDRLDNSISVKNGGKGSGNFGHSGREGKVGGSSKRDSYNLEVEDDGPKNVADTHEELRNITDWKNHELSNVIPYFGDFKNTEKVQEYLRGGDDAPISNIAMASDCVRTMKEKMARTEFPEDTILYRGMMIRNDRMDRVENNGFSYPGFQSTSLVGNDASRIIQEYKESGNYDPQFYTPVLLKIHAKKGQHFAASYMDVEHEIVLPPNIRMNVKNKAQTSLGMLYEVDYDEE